MDGAMLIKALEAAIESVPAMEISAEVVEECRISFQSRRADALAAMAESYLNQSAAARAKSSSTADSCRDRTCRFPGCTHTRYLDAHHIEHWADGGLTNLSNLVTLCRLHHRLVHEGEIIVETPADGSWRFLHPDGRHFEVIRCAESLPN